MSTMFARIMLVCVCCGVLPLKIHAAPASGRIPPGLMAYLEGLDALTQGQFPEAVAAFSRSLEASGQMMLCDESGSVSTMWYEFIDRDRMRITDMDGTDYEARRSR